MDAGKKGPNCRNAGVIILIGVRGAANAGVIGALPIVGVSGAVPIGAKAVDGVKGVNVSIGAAPVEIEDNGKDDVPSGPVKVVLGRVASE